MVRAKDFLNEYIIPLDNTVAQELPLNDDIIVEMANLTKNQTGINGIVFISTSMGNHGPRIKYFITAGKNQKSFSMTISEHPKIVANSLPANVVAKVENQLKEWISKNCVSLMLFWQEGDTWTDEQVSNFKASLIKV